MSKYILPIIVLFIGNAIAVFMLFSGPDAKQHEVKKHLPLVEVQPLEKQAFTVKIRSSGKVQASMQTKLVAEVAGKIIKLSPKFKEGAFFAKGDVLLQIEDSDFLNAVTVAKSEVEQKKLQLEEELARAKVAKKDWSLLDSKKQPNDLVSRKPHIANAKAALDAAKARLKQAERNLERTYVRAPYEGRVLNRKVDVGQYVSPGTVLGEVYANGILEVHLPVSLNQYKQLALEDTSHPNTKVDFYILQGKNKTTWQGHVVRSSASLDPMTNQLTVIATIDSKNKNRIKIGQFVRANIYGRIYKDVYVVPRSSVRGNKEILLLKKDKDGGASVLLTPVEVVRTEGNKSIIKAKLAEDAQLIITPMPLAETGLKVRVKTAKKSNGTSKTKQSSVTVR